MKRACEFSSPHNRSIGLSSAPTDLVNEIGQETVKSGPALSSVLFWGVLLVGLLLTVVVATTVEHIDEHVTEVRFEAEAMERSFLIREQFETAESALVDLASLYAASDTVTSDDFSRFVAPILERQAALRAFSWNPVVKSEEREAHEAAMQEAGNPGYRITHRSEQGELITAPAREQYIVVCELTSNPKADSLPSSGSMMATTMYCSRAHYCASSRTIHRRRHHRPPRGQ